MHCALFLLAILASAAAVHETMGPSDFSFESSSPHLNLTYPSAHPLASLQCREHDPMLEAAFSTWWDVRLDAEVWQLNCAASSGYGQSYLARIIDGKLSYTVCSASLPDEIDLDLLLLFGVVVDLIDVVGLPNMEFTFNTGDQPFSERMYWSPVPQLHWVASEAHWTIPIPNPFQLKAHWNNTLGDNSAVARAKHVPWAQRSAKVYWRGSVSVPDNSMYSTLQVSPRMRLMRIAASQPKLFNVGTTSIDQDVWWARLSKSEKNALTKTLSKSSKPFEASDQEAPKHKFVINVSAVLSSWRLVQLLATGAVLLLQSDSNHELLYGYLQPWVHYVPVKFDLSDLVPKVQYLLGRDDVAQRIAAAGFELFEQQVRRADTYCYMNGLLNGLRNLVSEGARRTPRKQRKYMDVAPDMLRVQLRQVFPGFATLAETLGKGAGEEPFEQDAL